MALDDALAKLSALDQEQGRVVELRFFGGLTEEETAEVLSVPSRTIKRKWVAANTFPSESFRRGDGTKRETSPGACFQLQAPALGAPHRGSSAIRLTCPRSGSMSNAKNPARYGAKPLILVCNTPRLRGRRAIRAPIRPALIPGFWTVHAQARPGIPVDHVVLGHCLVNVISVGDQQEVMPEQASTSVQPAGSPSPHLSVLIDGHSLGENEREPRGVSLVFRSIIDLFSQRKARWSTVLHA